MPAVLLLGLLLGLGAAAPAAGEPPAISAKRAEAQRVLADIQSLDSQLAHAIEAYNAAGVELQRIHTARRLNAGHLKLARSNLRIAQHRLGLRLRALYTSDQEDSTIAVLLGAKSLTDFLNRVDTVNRVADEDTSVLREINRFKKQMASHAVELKQADERQTSVVAERASSRRQVEEGLAERQRMLASIKDQIGQLRAQEARRQEQLRREAEARLRSQLAAQRTAQFEAQEETSVVGASAVSSEGVSVAPPSRYGGAVGIAMQYLGVPYVWGGASPSGFDCSGFIMYVYAQLGVSLPHYAASQYNYGTPVSRDQLEPGDLVFFNGLGHNGMYIGGGQFIHAPHTGDVVKISSLDDSWYASNWVGARRL